MLKFIAPILIATAGALVIWYADACRRGTVRRQRILGYRTALTMRDPNAWITVHRAMAPLLYIAGAGAALAGRISALLLFLGTGTAVNAVLGGAVAWLLLGTVLSALPASSAARDYKGDGPGRRHAQRRQ